jgi:ABC-2 type transport system ATP-binding protein
MLHLKGFKKYYHQRLVLAIDDFHIPPGIYWIKGINGSGKSTLLKAIAGILHFEGDIILNNALNLKKQCTAYREQVNFADAEPVFPPFLTGRELIALFRKAKKGTREQSEQYINDMEMQFYINAPVSTYSSGMLKKLSLVLAFLGHPEVILLDEPLITMDTAAVGVLYNWVREKNAAGVSFLLSSHQPAETGKLNISATLQVAAQTLKIEEA